MPRMSNRQIKADFWEDDKLLQLPRDARVLFAGLWSLAEDSGCLKNAPFQFKTKIFPSPYDSDLTVEVIAQHIDRLLSSGLLTEYRVDGDGYLNVTNFHEHQKPPQPNAPKEVPLPPWIEWRPSATKHRSGTYVLLEQTDDSQTTTSEQPTGCRFSGSQVLGSKDEEREEKESGTPLDAYHRHIGMITKTQVERLGWWQTEQGMDGDVITKAIEVLKEEQSAKRVRGHAFPYLDGILVNWYNDGIRTLEDIKERDGPQTIEEMAAYFAEVAASVEGGSS